jgi:hypothetical protein
MVWRDWWSAENSVEWLVECRRWCGGIDGVQEMMRRGWWSAGDGVEGLVA